MWAGKPCTSPTVGTSTRLTLAPIVTFVRTGRGAVWRSCGPLLLTAGPDLSRPRNSFSTSENHGDVSCGPNSLISAFDAADARGGHVTGSGGALWLSRLLGSSLPAALQSRKKNVKLAIPYARRVETSFRHGGLHVRHGTIQGDGLDQGLPWAGQGWTAAYIRHTPHEHNAGSHGQCNILFRKPLRGGLHTMPPHALAHNSLSRSSPTMASV